MRILFPFVLLIISFSSFSQNSTGVSKIQFSINFLMPALELETRVSNNSTIDLQLGTGFVLVSGDASDGTEFGFFPTFTAQYRNYHNFEKRMSKGKNILNISGNYIALHSAIYGGKPIIGDLESTANYGIEVGPVWGLHRVYKGGFKLNLNLGLGYGFNDQGDSAFGPIVGLRLGWLISNKN